MHEKWNRYSLMEKIGGFREARIIITAVELDIFNLLGEGPLSAAGVAGRINGQLRGVSVLLDALSAMEVLEKKNGSYRLAQGVEGLLTDASEASILPMVRHSANMWSTWSRLTDIVQSGPDESFLPIRQRGDEANRAFIEAMHAIGSPVAQAIVERINCRDTCKLLDIGGGSGVYIIAFLKAHRAMQAVLFDLPPVIEIARKFLAAENIIERVELVPGDYTTDVLPGGCDLAWLSAIIHQNSPAENRALFKKLHNALSPGGRLLIRDHIMDESRTAPADGALFAVNMLVGTEGGGSYTYSEVCKWLEDAGFEYVSLERGMGRMDDIVKAEKKAEQKAEQSTGQ